MTPTTSVDAPVERLVHTREALLRRADDLVAVGARLDDVVWPCQQHDHVAAAEFDSRNACLVAEALASRLVVSRPVLEDITTQLPPTMQSLAAEWFFVHHLVHEAQGLGYGDFRALNRVGNRHETMRPDCDADLISLKALAWLMALGETGSEATTAVPSDYRACLTYLVDEIVPGMMAMEPNPFIPCRREIEQKRIFALLLLRYHVAGVPVGAPLPDASFFPWWSEDRTQLYVLVGQVHALGRGAIAVDPDALGALLARLADGDVDAAYELVGSLDWPHRMIDDLVPDAVVMAGPSGHARRGRPPRPRGGLPTLHREATGPDDRRPPEAGPAAEAAGGAGMVGRNLRYTAAWRRMEERLAARPTPPWWARRRQPATT